MEDLSLDLAMLDVEDWLVHIQDMALFCVRVKAIELQCTERKFQIPPCSLSKIGPAVDISSVYERASSREPGSYCQISFSHLNPPSNRCISVPYNLFSPRDDNALDMFA